MCRRRAAGAERFEFRSQEENNMMLLLSRAGLRYNEKAIAPGADRSPERCRAGGGLLGGKDPAGRFALGVVTSVMNGFAACFARTPNQRANGQPDFLSGFSFDLGLISSSASRRRSSNSTRSGGPMSGHSTPGSCIGLGSPTSLSPLVRNAIRPTVAGPATGTRCRTGRLPFEVEVLRPVGRAGEGLLQLAGPLRGVERLDRRPLGGRDLGRVDYLEAGVIDAERPGPARPPRSSVPRVGGHVEARARPARRKQEGSHRRRRDAGSHKDTSLLSVELGLAGPESPARRCDHDQSTGYGLDSARMIPDHAPTMRGHHFPQ